jgi:hypothetical protein
MACTVVTAFYPIKSKFPSETYLNWCRTFLLLDSPIVLFTEESLVQTFMDIRGAKPIKIIAAPFESLPMWVTYEHHWKQNHTIDPEGFRHTPELYTIWAQKPVFVEKAIECNPFQTDYFFWCDIGAFRNPNISSTILQTFPTTTYLPTDRIIMQSMGDLHDNDKYMRPDGIYGECITSAWNEVRLVGGLWGGHRNGCTRWIQAYRQMLDKYFKAGRFAGKDQQVMLSAYLEDPSLAYIVQPTTTGIDNWFFFEHLLSTLPVRYERNPTYIIHRS